MSDIDDLAEMVEHHFPKGECQERGAAMVMCSEFLMWHKAQRHRSWVRGYVFGWITGTSAAYIGFIIGRHLK